MAETELIEQMDIGDSFVQSVGAAELEGQSIILDPLRLNGLPDTYAVRLSSQAEFLDDRYTYNDLPYEDSIRLIRLHPGAKEDPLSCELCVDRIQEKPSYRAVSYVWGSPKFHDTISCDGMLIPLTENLADALRRVRSTAETLTLWADAACIDQNNVDERGHQVQLMGDIYRNAKEVLVHVKWSKSEEDHALVNQLLSMNSDSEVSEYLRSQSAARRIWKTFWKAKWFTRTWTVQEVGLAKKATVLSGKYEFNWERLMEVASFTSLAPMFLDASTPARHLWASYDHRGRRKYCSRLRKQSGGFLFLYCLARAARSRKASDPRDFVYAFLAHPYAPPLVPNYRNTPDTVSFHLATEWLRLYRSADILGFACNHDAKKMIGRPTWCPAWELLASRPISLISNVQWSRYDASNGDRDFDFELQNMTLNVTGIPFDNVQLCSEPCHGRTEEGYESTQTDAAAILLKLLEKSTISDHVYPARHLALCKLLTTGDWASTEQECLHILQNVPGWRESTVLQPHKVEGFGDPTELERLDFSARAWMRIHHVTWRRRFFTTKRGYIGLGPPDVRPGDVCCIIKGARTPFLLRPDGSGGHKVIGEAYIQGVMSGEIMRNAELRSSMSSISLI